MPTELPPQYDPHSVESRSYQQWLDARAFHAAPDDRPPDRRYSIVIPPPNVTGALHLGHAINGTIQDILTRYHRMKGDNTLWMPGIDHAGIATQAVVEKTIFEKEHKSRHDLGREELVRRIWEWKEQYGTRILKQLASIGASCDWDRTRFTLDEVCAKAVREAFFKMFKDGLIFRGKRLVNWDTHLQTAVADDEIYHETVKGQMTSIKYPVADDAPPAGAPHGNAGPSAANTEYLVVATTRPETMLGDTAVAVHPDDPRYQHLIGKHVIVPLVGRKIPIIADGLLVDPAFGTGVVKVTPAHDPNDYATGLRHNLEQINLLTPDGRVSEKGSGVFLGKQYSYTGLKFATAARKAVLEDLAALNLIANQKPHEHEVGHSDRSRTPIEPYLSDQWFVRMGDITAERESEPQKSEPRPSGSGLSEPRPSGSGFAEGAPQPLPHGRGSEVPQHSSALAYFITFHTYATWVRGDAPGAVDDSHNAPGTPFIPPDPRLTERELSHASEPPFSLSLPQRQSILHTLQEVATHRGWTLHAANVRTTHIHAVVSGSQSPERMMNDFKSYATHRLTEAGLIPADTKIWARHGSTPYLWKPDDLAAAVDYAVNRQGENAPGTFTTGSQPQLSEPRPSEPRPSEPRPSGSGLSSPTEKPLPYGRGSDGTGGVTLGDGTRAAGLAQAAIDAVADGRVKIIPERYAKGYTDWLAQKRDWCISRQLWWGHRIPVWVFLWNGPIATSPSDSQQVRLALPFLTEEQNQQLAVQVIRPGTATGEILIGITVRPGFPEIERALELHNGEQDPDVLDTWFSSALWPLSTMGWPNATPPSDPQKSEPRPSGSGFAEGTPQPLPHGRGSEGRVSDGRVSDGMPPEPTLLPYFYPTSVLSTGRDILTLWVARMVMFGLYCGGDVPFKHVYIHTTIQDGEGRPMKKTLGNGLDPIEVVASHGADAMRFTLASMSTETQDVRMPVTKDPKTGHNTSPKFDLGRNFANKIWNAARYILGAIADGSDSSMPKAPHFHAGLAPSHVEDRWILSRLNAAITAAAAAIETYRFAELADSLRSFFWTDLCDWYLEIAKARIKSGDATVQSILLHCLRTSLQLLHPLMPFITEELWSKLPHEKIENQKSNTENPPITPGAPHGNAGLSHPLLITGPWPKADPAAIDPAAESQLALIQSVTTAIREIQNRYPAAKGKPIILQPRDPATQKTLDASRSIIEPLTGSSIAENSPAAQKPGNAATAVLPDAGGIQIFIAGVIDKSAEAAKITKRLADLEKQILGSRNKLGNEAFAAKAPPKIIQGLRDQLAKQETEYAALKKNLEELQ